MRRDVRIIIAEAYMSNINLKFITTAFAVCFLVFLVYFVKWHDEYYWALSSFGFGVLFSYIIYKTAFKK